MRRLLILAMVMCGLAVAQYRPKTAFDSVWVLKFGGRTVSQGESSGVYPKWAIDSLLLFLVPDSSDVSANSHRLQGKDTTALWNAKTLQWKDTTGHWPYAHYSDSSGATVKAYKFADWDSIAYAADTSLMYIYTRGKKAPIVLTASPIRRGSVADSLLHAWFDTRYADVSFKDSIDKLRQNIGNSIGSQGPKGDSGPPGASGKDGYTPVKGVDYFDGKDGRDGADGSQGIQGVQGNQGVVGATGARGPPGETGLQGPQGIQGVRGDSGARGLQGIQGVQGNTGTAGAKGDKGDQGIQGNAGTPGAAGAATWDAMAQVTGSDATTTGQSLVDVTGLTAPLLANSKYEIEAVLLGSVTAVTTGTKYGVQFSAAGATAYVVYAGAVTSTTGAVTSTNALNSADATAFLTTSAMTGIVTIKGLVTTGANPGNITIQHLKVTSGTSSVKVGSQLKVRRIV